MGSKLEVWSSHWVTGHLILYFRGARSGEECQGVPSSLALSLHPRALAENWWSARAWSCLPDRLTPVSWATDGRLSQMHLALMAVFSMSVPFFFEKKKKKEQGFK